MCGAIFALQFLKQFGSQRWCKGGALRISLPQISQYLDKTNRSFYKLKNGQTSTITYRDRFVSKNECIQILLKATLTYIHIVHCKICPIYELSNLGYPLSREFFKSLRIVERFPKIITSNYKKQDKLPRHRCIVRFGSIPSRGSTG